MEVNTNYPENRQEYNRNILRALLEKPFFFLDSKERAQIEQDYQNWMPETAGKIFKIELPEAPAGLFDGEMIESAV